MDCTLVCNHFILFEGYRSDGSGVILDQNRTGATFINNIGILQRERPRERRRFGFVHATGLACVRFSVNRRAPSPFLQHLLATRDPSVSYLAADRVFAE
jgi:hypothetical protein